MTVARSVGDVLAEHVLFETDCVDRMYCNVYVPQLQYAEGLVGYVHRQLGLPIASTAPLARITKAFDKAVHRFARDHRLPWVDFAKGQRKDDVMHEHLARFTATEGVLFVGRAQEKTKLFRTEKRRDNNGDSYPWIVASTGLVNHFYFYCVDDDFGPFFITRVSQLRGGCRAGQFVVAVFTGIGLSCVNARNSCCDKASAKLGEHVFEGDVVLVRVPGLIGAAAGEVVGVVAVQRVPDDDEAVDAEAQWHGALHRALQPVAGLADAEQLFAAGDGDLDRPAGGVAGDHGLGVTGGVGSEDRHDLFTTGLADEDGAAFGVAERTVPDRIDDGDLNGVAAAVARDRGLPPGRGRGDLGRGAEPVALQPGSAAFAGAGWGGCV